MPIFIKLTISLLTVKLNDFSIYQTIAHALLCSFSLLSLPGQLAGPLSLTATLETLFLVLNVLEPVASMPWPLMLPSLSRPRTDKCWTDP